jgi:glutamate 5-kinase
MEDRSRLKEKGKIVIKVGTSSLTYSNGQINYESFEKLVDVICQLRKMKKQVLLVTSGAIAVGAGKIGLQQKPSKLAEKQALAAIGQAELIKIYEKYFASFNQIVAQVLITKDGVITPIRRQNAKNTLNTLLSMGIVPIINENDTVSTDEIEFGDNDTLSAHVSVVSEADLLVILSDIDGLYNGDPKKDANVKIISKVNAVEEVEEFAGSTNSEFAKGGMVTKIAAAKLCYHAGIDMVIAKGEEPSVVLEILAGKDVGTLFVGKSDFIDKRKKQQPTIIYRDKLG